MRPLPIDKKSTVDRGRSNVMLQQPCLFHELEIMRGIDRFVDTIHLRLIALERVSFAKIRIDFCGLRTLRFHDCDTFYDLFTFGFRGISRFFKNGYHPFPLFFLQRNISVV